MATILTDNRIEASDAARDAGGDLWMPVADYERILGGTPPAEHCRDDDVAVSALWRDRERPVMCDSTGEVWVLGKSARERAAALESLQAPDFTLPDLEGRAHSLSDYRGKKVFLASWSSW